MGLKRILVPVDASPNSLEALEAAAEMGARHGAELIGLFVEESNLLLYTEHGFAREVSLCSCSLRPIQRREMELQLRARAEQIRKALSTAGNKWGLPWRFHVSRGTVRSEIQRAASEVDLTVLGKAGWSQILSNRAGSTVQGLISTPGTPTLVLQQGGRIRPTICAVYTGSALSDRTLAATPDLLQLERFRIIVYIPQDAPEGFAALRRKAAALLPARAQADFRSLSSPCHAHLLRELRENEFMGPVILPCEPPEFQGQTLNQFVNEVSVPVLLIKKDHEDSQASEAE